MTTEINWFGCSLLSILLSISSFNMMNNAYSQEQEKFLEWSITTSKQTFYPGEPVLLTLNIKNTGTQKEEVDFGADGIEAFSMEIRDSNNIVMSAGGQIQRWGISRIGYLQVAPGKTVPKLVVLNQWCSTLLSPGKYKVICNIEYRLRSESQKRPDTTVVEAGPIHKKQLELEIKIIETDKTKFKKILEDLAGFEVKPEAQDKGKWLAERRIAREMLTFTESELAVPYQLQLLRVEQYTWRKRDITNSLVKSGTPEAASGLLQIIKDPSVYKEDVNNVLIDGIYRLREKGNSEIKNATEDFVAKHKRPVLCEPQD